MDSPQTISQIHTVPRLSTFESLLKKEKKWRNHNAVRQALIDYESKKPLYMLIFFYAVCGMCWSDKVPCGTCPKQKILTVVQYMQ